MSNKVNLKPLALALGTAFATSLAGTGIASAADNPFAITELSSGYMVADSHEGKCGEGKCGAKTGTETTTETDGKTDAEGKCGTKIEAEGKCGEGKCGGNK